jgi:uncharacterized glyoxalase superfamily protein PhnB
MEPAMPTDPLDQLRLPPMPLQPRREFADQLRRQLIHELAPLLSTRHLEEVTTMPADTQVETAPTITVALSCNDAHGLIRWLVELLEFRVAAVHEEPGRGIAHAQLTWRTGNVFLSSRHPGVWGRTGPASICLAADDPAEVDRLYQKALAAHAEIVDELHDEDYGDHIFGVRDPEGNLWAIGTYRPPVAQ